MAPESIERVIEMSEDQDGLLAADDVETLFRCLETEMPGGSGSLPAAKSDADAFRAAIGCILSAQSQDENTREARERLFELADTPRGILALDEDAIVDAIRPAGLYNRKCRSIRRFCDALLDEFDGQVPSDRKALMALPGIGRKCADILLRFTFGEAVIAVDTHVHRVCNRTGLARGKTGDQTARSLEPRVPDWAAVDGHLWLIQFGKRVCTSRKPTCSDCPVRDLCLYENKTPANDDPE